MITYAILAIFVSIFDFASTTIFPALPNGVSAVLSTIFDYMADGIDILSCFIDLDYALSIFAWWISFGALILTVEMLYSIWHKITGNAGSVAYTESNTIDSDGSIITTKTSKRVSRPRLPRF